MTEKSSAVDAAITKQSPRRHHATTGDPLEQSLLCSPQPGYTYKACLEDNREVMDKEAMNCGSERVASQRPSSEDVRTEAEETPLLATVT